MYVHGRSRARSERMSGDGGRGKGHIYTSLPPDLRRWSPGERFCT